ncbi:hypothetical protein V8E36_009127 [Tilletia maclaganii]
MAIPRRRVFYLFLIFRLSCGIACTYFQPDEFWQSLEVAHRIVFGYGYQTWEWRDGRAPLDASSSPSAYTWDTVIKGSPVRSIAYPAIFVPVYWLLKVLRLDDYEGLMAYAPRAVQAVFAAVGDLYTYRLVERVAGEDTAWDALHIIMGDTYMGHTSVRTFSNSLEATLTTAALYYWPVGAGHEGRRQTNILASLFFMSLAFIIRPTSAILWVFLGLGLVWRHPRSTVRIAAQCAAAIGLALGIQIYLDSLFYGRLTITSLAFLQVNVLEKSPVSLFYGHAPSHYYFTQALPVICLAATPSVVIGWALTLSSRPERFFSALKAPETATLFSRAALWVMLCMSALGHKEWRFVQQLRPIWILFQLLVMRQHEKELDSERERGVPYGTAPVAAHPDSDPDPSTAADTPAPDSSASQQLPKLPERVRTFLDKTLILIILLFLSQLVLLPYLILYHGRGQRTVTLGMHRHETHIHTLGFLMPCHSTPWQSDLHLPHLESAGPSGDGGNAWFLTCEPPLQGQELSTYRHQTRVFYEDPYQYLIDRFPAKVDPTFPPSPYPPAEAHADGSRDWRHTWPSHLVLFSTLLDRQATVADARRTNSRGQMPTVGELLRDKGYVETQRDWNGFFSDDENRWGSVLILEWQAANSSLPYAS